MNSSKVKYLVLPVLALIFIASILVTVYRATQLQSRVLAHQETIGALGKVNEELTRLSEDVSYIDILDKKELLARLNHPFCKGCIPPKLHRELLEFIQHLDINTPKREVERIRTLSTRLIRQENDKLHTDTLDLEGKWTQVGILSLIACFFALLSSILYVQYLNKHKILTETNEKLNEAKLEAERSMRAKVSFLNMLSHEIRTPLNAVIGLTNILATEEKNEQQSKNLDLLKFSSENLLSLVNNVLDFGKIEAGKLVLEEREFNLKKHLTKIIGSLEPNANAKNVSLQLEYDNTLPDMVISDPTRLSQILFNLVINAIKFTSVGGVILRVERIGQELETVQIRYSVIDSGIGIAPDKIQLVFKRYEQASSSTSRLYGGSGLGLSITQKLVSLLGGIIEVESELGLGSNFFFSLQHKIGKGTLQVIKPIKTNVNGTQAVGRILLVEDNRINRLILSKYLNRINCEVEFAENGNIALQKIEKESFDLVLMDLQMPEMDGYTASEKIREKYSEKELPVIAISATSGHMLQRDYRESGINDFLSKPVDHSELVNKVLKYL